MHLQFRLNNNNSLIPTSVCMVICLTITLFSCKTRPKDAIDVIDLTDALSKSRIAYLSEVASSIEYIPLETSEESFIGYIEDVKFFDKYIFILDSRQKAIQIFDNKGNHIRKILKNGRGPGEYLNIKDFEINTRDSTILVFDNEMDKLIKYRLNGDFLKEWRVQDNYASSFSLFNEESYVFLTVFPLNTFNDGYSISIYDKDVKVKNRFLKNDIVSEEIANLIDVWGMLNLDQYRDTVIYWEFKKDLVYNVIDHKTVTPRFKIKYPNPIPIKATLDEVKKSNSLHGFIETLNYIFFWGQFQNDFFRMIYIKNTKEFITLSLKDRGKLDYGFMNDLDGGYSFYPQGPVTEKKVYNIISLYRLKLLLADSTNLRNEVKSETNRAVLANLIKSSKLGDNSCIVIVTLK